LRAFNNVVDLITGFLARVNCYTMFV
jgi:hypothetical protein